MVKLLLVCALESLNLAIKLWSTWSDIQVSIPRIFDMPVELSLKLMTTIGTNRVESKRVFLDDIIDEIDSIYLGMSPVDIQCFDPGCIVDSVVLETTDSLSISILELQKLDINLYMISRRQCSITLRVSGSTWC